MFGTLSLGVCSDDARAAILQGMIHSDRLIASQGNTTAGVPSPRAASHGTEGGLTRLVAPGYFATFITEAGSSRRSPSNQ
jgi:hypothetical protein